MDLKSEHLERQFATGPFAALRFMQACQPSMVARGGGRIINMASGTGMRSTAGYAPYAMAKEALRSLTRSAAREWGKEGITVNNVCPVGVTDALLAAFKRGFQVHHRRNHHGRWWLYHVCLKPNNVLIFVIGAPFCAAPVDWQRALA